MKEIYGVSYKDGKAVYVEVFFDEKNAKEWLYTEEFDFRERQILTFEELEKEIDDEEIIEYIVTQMMPGQRLHL